MAFQAMGGLDLVYVDPDGDAATRVGDLLGAAGATVRTASTGESGVAAVRDRRPDCVVTEFQLPDWNGLDLLRRVRAVHDEVPVVVFSDADGSALGGVVLDAGGAYVPKHGDGAARLRRRLANLFEGESAVGISEAVKERAMDEAPVGITVANATLPDEPLVYVNDAFERLTGYSAEEMLGRNCRVLQGPDTDPDAVRQLRAAIDAERPTTVELRNYRRNGDPFWNRVEVAPIRDSAGTVTHYVGFQSDVTRLRRAATAARRWAEECRDKRRTVERVLDEVRGLVEDVTKVLVDASSRREVEYRVCERVGATDSCTAAWVGEADLGRDEVTTSACAGEFGADLADRSLPISEDTPAGAAVAADDVRIATGADTVSPDVDWSAGASSVSVVAVPLTYAETTYGVLAAYATDPDGLGDETATVLASVGRATASAIDAFENKRMVAADGVVDLELTVTDDRIAPVELASVADRRFTFEGANRRKDGTLLVFLATDGRVPTDIQSLADGSSAVERVSVVRNEPTGSLLEVVLSAESVLSRVGDRSARVTDLDATRDRVELSFEVPGEPAARSVVTALEARYDGVEVRKLHHRDRAGDSRHGFVREVRASLTDRQLSALQTAYFAGFFEWPHEVSGDELASSMDVTRSTFHQHLRAGQRKLLASFFGESA
jgi:PAS domain S-box-containing protein